MLINNTPEVKDGFLQDWLQHLGVPAGLSDFLAVVMSILLLAAIAYILDHIARRGTRSILGKIILKTSSRWDNVFYEKGVFNSLAHLAPVIGLQILTPLLLSKYPFLVNNAKTLYEIAFLVVVILFTINTISALEIIGTHENKKRTIAVSTFSQLLKVLAVIIGILILISILLKIDIKTTLTSLGVLSAVIVLVFRDTILGFVSGVQLAATKSIQVGDWVTLPDENVDGTVVEVNLATAKIRNFDMTISTVPTYSLISSTVTNNQPMSALQIRRIKRSVYINTKSIRFVSETALADFKRFELIQNYVSERQAEIRAFNQRRDVDKSKLTNGRNQTNIGIFREYIREYLNHHPNVAQEQTLMVRLLEPTKDGVPIEIYCFANTGEWVSYEGVQSDILDHILAAAAEFDLEVFQNPSGLDINRLIAK